MNDAIKTKVTAPKLTEAQLATLQRFERFGAHYTSTPPHQDDEFYDLVSEGLLVGRRNWEAVGGPQWKYELTSAGRQAREDAINAGRTALRGDK